MPVGGMMWSDLRVSRDGHARPRRRIPPTAPGRAPMCTAPSIWPSSSVGLIALPTSWAAITFSIRPSSSSSTTCVAQRVGEVGDRLGRVVRRRPVDQDLPAELPSGELLDRVLLECGASACAPRRSTALPPSTVARDAVVWPVSSSRSVSTSDADRGRPADRAPRRRSGAGPCARPAPSPSRSGRA